MEILSINLTDLPKDKITIGSNGKKYISIVVDSRKEPDKFGNDLALYINPTKEEREAKTEKVYCGSGKTITFNKAEVKVPVKASVPDDNLPF